MPSLHGRDQKCIKNFGRKETGQLGSPSCKWEDNIRMHLREIRLGSCGLDSSGSG